MQTTNPISGGHIWMPPTPRPPQKHAPLHNLLQLAKDAKGTLLAATGFITIAILTCLPNPHI